MGNLRDYTNWRLYYAIIKQFISRRLGGNIFCIVSFYRFNTG
jgi:hypothetical protein